MTLFIHSFAAAGRGLDSLQSDRHLDWPKPGSNRQGGRLAKLACELAATALAASDLDEELSLDSGADFAVLFATALGALTETELFTSHMIAADEATPKPRAFTASVHNAIASQVALKLGARGECQTFVHRDIGLAHSLFAADCLRRRSPRAPILVGSFDEAPSGQFASLASAAGDEVRGSSSTIGSSTDTASVFLLGPDPQSAIAKFDSPVFGRRGFPEAWLERECQGLPILEATADQSLGASLALALQAGSSTAILCRSETDCSLLRLEFP